jgi:diacylglycerol kinase (ATP)
MTAAHQIDPGRWAVVLNPTKFDDVELIKSRLVQVAASCGWPAPDWYLTEASDPGQGQAAHAVACGATLVCPLGGDGTVRAVAAGLLGTEVPLGLLPGGTGNLLARNLGMPVDDWEACLATALTGRTALIDVGEVRWDGGPPEAFLVMAGMGMDAEIMAGVDEGLKKRVGWWAYVASGARTLFRLGFAVRVRAGSQRLRKQHARTVLVGNCGELTGGVRLIPQAAVDDGLLDVVVASPNSLFSWVALGLHVISGKRRGHRALVHLQDQEITVHAAELVEAQLDGDAVGAKRRMVARVLPSALPVRLPR